MSKQKQNAELGEKKSFIERVRVPAVVAIGIGTLATGLFLGRNQEHGSKPLHDPSAELRSQAANIIDQATGCYAFGDGPLIITRATVNGQAEPALEIPIKDTSTHQPGKEEESWTDASTQSHAMLSGDSEFVGEYSVVDGRKLATPLHARNVWAEAGTTEESASYNLVVVPNPSMRGLQEVKVFYTASVDTQNTLTKAHEITSGNRLCGVAVFTVENNGTISNARVVPDDEVGKLHIDLPEVLTPQ